MPKVSLEAIFKESGLDKLGRAFDGIAQKMKRMADVQKSWGGGASGDDSLRRQFKIGQEIELSNGKIREATKHYMTLRKTMDEHAQNPAIRNRIKSEMDDVAGKIVKETALRDRMNRSIAEEGVVSGRNMMIRRGLKLGLATLGVPYTIAGIARGLGEANEQSRMVSPMAARMVGTSGSGGPDGMRNFTDYSMRLRENIVDTGAAMAFSGRESIQLADSLLTMSGSMKGFKEALVAARELGISPQVTTQLVGTARRFGGIGGGGQMTDEKFVGMIARGIGDSGMGPRGAEYIQSIVATMSAYSTRVPNVDAGIIASVIEAVNKQATMSGASALKGSGALQFTQGITSMMDDNSEAMIAIQTQIISRNKDRYGAAATKYGIEGPLQGTAAYGLALALKQEGIAGPDGLKLAGDTIKMILGGQDANTRKIMESTVLRLPMTMIKSLEMGGKNSLMEKLLDGRLGSDEVMRRASGGGMGMAMQTPGMAYGRLGTDVAALATNFFSGIVSPTTNLAGAGADMLEEYLPGGAKTSREASARRKKMMTGGAGLTSYAFGIGASMVAPEFALPLMGIGALAMGGAALMGDGKDSGKSAPREINHILDVRITAKEDFQGVASGIAKIAAKIMGTSMHEEAKKSQEVGGMGGSTSLNNVKYGGAP